MALSRAEVGMLQTQVNTLEAHIESLNDRLQSAGVFVPDYVDQQMAGVRVQIDTVKQGVGTYASQATEKVDKVIQELLIHQQALGQQPLMMTELEQVKETTVQIIVKVNELADRVEKSFTSLREDYSEEFQKVKTYVDRQDAMKTDKVETQAQAEAQADASQAYRDAGGGVLLEGQALEDRTAAARG